MNRIVLLAQNFKKHFYAAGVDKPKGFQITIFLMGAFLLVAVLSGLTSPEKASGVFFALSIFYMAFPLVFPKSKSDSP